MARENARNSDVERENARNAVEVRKSGEAAMVEFRHTLEILQDRAQEASNSAALEIAPRVAAQIMQSGTLDEIFQANESGPGSLRDAEEMHGRPVTILTDTITFFKGYEQYSQSGIGLFATWEVIDLNGEKRMLSTGAPNVLFSLYRMQQLRENGVLDEDPQVVFRSRPTPNGALLLVTRP